MTKCRPDPEQREIETIFMKRLDYGVWKTEVALWVKLSEIDHCDAFLASVYPYKVALSS